MERTFVDSLVEQNAEGNFHKFGTNCHAIMCALYDVNKEKVIAKCYVNAYEDQYANLCVLFGPDHLDTELGEVDNDVESFVVVPRYLAELTQDGITTRVQHTVNVPADGSVDSTSLWRFMERYYPSDEDEVDSILSLSGVPRGTLTATNDIPNSPIVNYVSVEHPSSSASNDFPYPSK
ncbi:hypothetical protein Salat_2398200 [Sesamum alatum]|uniref:Uncharacterized protein n=1 Tax=Sesamum alatum TaxID=300844 RepID=A0AAE2CF59_9LAMI|nr:hypothetical protein Salat_2398200 [Sesamum alatum]